MAALKNGAKISAEFQPQNNKQAYLAYLCGVDIALPEPRTFEEVLLYKLCVDGIGGGTSSDEFAITDASYLFYYAARTANIAEYMSRIKGCTTMRSMFEYCGSNTFMGALAECPDLSGLDTSSVKSMDSMFSNCKRWASIDVSKFDTSEVTSMYKMFFQCASLKSLDMSNFDTSKVENMDLIFDFCPELTEIIGFSAVGLPEGQVVSFPYNTSGECVLERLTFRTDLPDGQIAVKFHIDLSGAPMTRLPMVDMFESLPDVSKVEGSKDWAQITIYGSAAVSGHTDIKAGSYDGVVSTAEELARVVERYSLYGAVCYVTREDGQEIRAGLGDVLIETAERSGILPFHKIRWEDNEGVDCAMLTAEDKAIATDKGWTIVGG